MTEPDTGQKISVNFKQLHDLTLTIVAALSREHREASGLEGMLACGLCVARFANGPDMSDDEEIKFVQDMVEWVGAYFTKGTPS